VDGEHGVGVVGTKKRGRASISATSLASSMVWQTMNITGFTGTAPVCSHQLSTASRLAFSRTSPSASCVSVSRRSSLRPY